MVSLDYRSLFLWLHITTKYLLPCCYLPECTGEEAFGLENGAIKDQQITAFSQYDADHGPENARLNHAADGRKTGAWSAKTNDANQWLQVDFGRNVKITKFQTQGRQDWEQWVKTYTLSFSEENEQAYQTYQENDVDKVTKIKSQFHCTEAAAYLLTMQCKTVFVEKENSAFQMLDTEAGSGL